MDRKHIKNVPGVDFLDKQPIVVPGLSAEPETVEKPLFVQKPVQAILIPREPVSATDADDPDAEEAEPATEEEQQPEEQAGQTAPTASANDPVYQYYMILKH